jgi:hypothetical protein
MVDKTKKAAEKAVIAKFMRMGAQSLNPDDYVELERIVKEIVTNRRLTGADHG